MASTANLGDDIQALAAKQFLPRVDIIFDRELNQVNSKDIIKVSRTRRLAHIVAFIDGLMVTWLRYAVIQLQMWYIRVRI